MKTLFAWIFSIMLLCAPHQPKGELTKLAQATYNVVSSEPHLFTEDADGRKTAAYIMAVEYKESGFDNSAIGDKSKSLCAMQILGGMLTLLGDPEACVRQGYSLIRTSFKLCRKLPVEERLAYYARGSCDSEEGRWLSRKRYRLAMKFAKIDAVVKSTDWELADRDQ